MARRLLRLLGTRYGIALVLLALIIGVVGIVRATGDASPPEATAPIVTTPASPADAELGDDSVVTEESPPVPSTSPGGTTPDVVAAEFARAWLKHTNVTGDQWRQGLARHATPKLLERLKHTDPAIVPADRITGPVQVNTRDAALVEATIPVDSGTLRLRLVGSDGRWLVDGVDWERA